MSFEKFPWETLEEYKARLDREFKEDEETRDEQEKAALIAMIATIV